MYVHLLYIKHILKKFLIYFRLRWVFVTGCGSSLAVASRVYVQVAGCGPVAVASPVGEHWVWGEQASGAVAYRL